jgi:methionyl-tRNA formyltransferase
VRIVFLGSGAFAIPSLQALAAAGHEVAGVVTQPDREKGRGRSVQPPPVKPVAQALGLRVLQPPRIRAPEAQEELRALAPELQVVVAYGQILPRAVIDLAPRGTINVHSSLLPRYRGAAPIHWAIVNGDTETGVTTMMIDEGLDTGPILLSRATPIGAEETTPELEARLARMGGELLVQTIDGIARGTVSPVPQDHAAATAAPILRKEDGRIDWTATAEVIARRVRGLQPWPGTMTAFGSSDLKILRASPVAAAADGPAPVGTDAPGAVVAIDEGIVVACGGRTRLRVLEVQPASRRAMPALAFAAGARLSPGARLG